MQAGIEAVPTSLHLPKRAAGFAEVGARLKLTSLRGVDLLWVNDPALGVHCLKKGLPVIYDITDDWRSYGFPARITERIVRAEDVLAQRALTVVCSERLRELWLERYGVKATVVHNGVDGAAWSDAKPRKYEGQGPHAGYLGTIQPERLDVQLVLELANSGTVGTVHLIGPDSLNGESRARLQAHPRVALHGPIPSGNVPSWTKGLDVLLSPHVISPFTLSLDAIKSYEYLASGRPIVATPTSGFQLLLNRSGVFIAERDRYLEAVASALRTDPPSPVLGPNDWDERANSLAELLFECASWPR